MIGMHGSFKSTKSTLVLSVIRTNEDLLRLSISTPGVETYGCIDLAPSDAPALALVILEAAGVKPYALGKRTYLGTAVVNLQAEVSEQEERSAEAKEQAELEGEALALRNALHGASETDFPTWPGESEAKENWLAVARKARELGGRAEK